MPPSEIPCDGWRIRPVSINLRACFSLLNPQRVHLVASHGEVPGPRVLIKRAFIPLPLESKHSANTITNHGKRAEPLHLQGWDHTPRPYSKQLSLVVCRSCGEMPKEPSATANSDSIMQRLLQPCRSQPFSSSLSSKRMLLNDGAFSWPFRQVQSAARSIIRVPALPP